MYFPSPMVMNIGILWEGRGWEVCHKPVCGNVISQASWSSHWHSTVGAAVFQVCNRCGMGKRMKKRVHLSGALGLFNWAA